MITTIQEVEIQLAFLYGTGDKEFEAYPRPNRVKGESPYTGFRNWQDAITPVADYSETTNQDFIDWENARLIKNSEDAVSRQNIKTSLLSYNNITLKEYEIIVSIEERCAGIFMSGATPSIDAIFSTLQSLLVGTPLLVPTINYIETVTGFSIGTDKGREFNIGMQFLRIIKNAYDTLN